MQKSDGCLSIARRSFAWPITSQQHSETCTRPRPHPHPRLMPTRSCYQSTGSIGGSQHLRSRSENQEIMYQICEMTLVYSRHFTQHNSTQHINKGSPSHFRIVSGPSLSTRQPCTYTHTHTQHPYPTPNLKPIVLLHYISDDSFPSPLPSLWSVHTLPTSPHLGTLYPPLPYFNCILYLVHDTCLP